MSRAEKIGLGGTVFGIGVTVVTAALSLADVDMSAVLLWVMGAVGVVLTLGGLIGGIVSWRARTHDHGGEDVGPRDLLKTALVRERASGQELLPGLGILSRGALFPRVTPAVVEAWENRVRDLLQGRPDMLQIFMHDPPESAIGQVLLADRDALFGGPLAKRLRRRLAQLDKVIELLL